jgi:hypothetical protein
MGGRLRNLLSSCRSSVVLASALLLAGSVRADTWFPPRVESYSSADGAWRLTVTPRDIENPLAYFGDKVKGREPAGAVPGDTSTRARGSMAHLEHGKWRTVWEKSLLNEVSPVSAIVSPSGRTVTFDNWHSMGYGSHAIVIYDDHGKLVRAMSLEDFLPTDYIRALPRTVSSIHWGRDHRFSDDGHDVLLRVVVPEVVAQWPANADPQQYIDLAFDLATGGALPRDETAWSRALSSVKELNEHNDRIAAEQKARFIAPFTAPRSDHEQEWHEYLGEVFFRMDGDWGNGYPATAFIRLPKHADFAKSVNWLEEALSDDVRSNVVMVASPSQEHLVSVVAKVCADVAPGKLQGTRIYVAADDAHTAAIARALAPTGATYIQLDPEEPIPQRRERLVRYLQANP